MGGFLVEAGHEALHWSVVGHAKAKDSEICGYARHQATQSSQTTSIFLRSLLHTRDTGPSVALLRGEAIGPGNSRVCPFARHRDLSGRDRPRSHRDARLVGPATCKSAPVTIIPRPV